MTLYVRDSQGSYTPASPSVVITEARKAASRALRKGAACTSPEAAEAAIRLHIGELEHEVFGCLLLDNQNKVIRWEILFRGTIDGASVYPREVVKAALASNAAAVIFAHNHPSGISEPSNADRTITARLQQALGLVDIRVLDHFIVGDSVYSFAQHGLL